MLERRLRKTAKQITNPIGPVQVEKYSGLHPRSLDGHSALALPHPQKPHSVYEGQGELRVGSLEGGVPVFKIARFEPLQTEPVWPSSKALVG